MQQNEHLNKPFFVQFLEDQKKEERNTNSITKPWLDIQHTDKYPSDGDEETDA